MPIIPHLTTTIPAGTSYYRITSPSLRKGGARAHRKVVSGEGAVRSRHGGRYNHPGARAVYLTEDVPTCFAEKMFYFHRDVLEGLDGLHSGSSLPSFQERYLLWEVRFQAPTTDVFDLTHTNASAMNVFPTLIINPSQDYQHLKDGRAEIEHNGYRGLRAPSSRVRGAGHMAVLFEDQSRNVRSIVPFDVDFRLIIAGTPSRPFMNHRVDLLDFSAGEVRVHPPAPRRRLPAALRAYADWTRIEFNS